MRPRNIEMQAFGAYLNRTAVDFTLLYDSRLFLITGPTGCGKTSILDAMSYALYGRATGSVRDVRDMRNTAAPRELDTQVRFEFELDGEIYRFDRSIHLRQKRLRGGGAEVTTDYEAACYLSEGDGWRLIVSGTNPVREKAVELLGFSHEQFSQVVVLPQGEFRRLLTASSIEKQKILETLFGTRSWQQLVRALGDRVRGQENALAALKTREQALLDGVNAGDAQSLQTAYEETGRALALAAKELEGLNAGLQSRTEAFNRATALETAFAERETALKRFAQLEAAADEIAAQKQKLTRYGKAKEIAPYYRAAAEASARLEQARQAKEAADAALAQAVRAVENAQQAAAAAPGIELRIRQAADRIAALEQMLGLAQSYDAALRSQAGAEKTLERAQNACVEAKKQADGYAERVKTLQDEIKRNFENFLAVMPAVKSRKGELEAAKERLEDEQRLVGEARRLEGQVLAKREEFKTVRQRYDTAKHAFELLEAAARSDAAFSLSQTLADGRPCPVCGATRHPLPAKPVGNAPSQAELQTQKSLIHTIEENLNRVMAEGADLRAAYDAKAGQLAQIRQKIAERPGLAEPEPVMRELAAVAARLEECEKAEKAQHGLEEKLTALQEQSDRWRQELEEATAARDREALNVSALRGGLRQLEQTLPGEQRDAGRLADEIRSLKERNDREAKQLEELRQNRQQAQSGFAAAQATCGAAARALDEALGQCDRAQADCRQRLESAGLTGQDIPALLLSEEAALQIERQIESHDRERYALHESVARLQERLQGMERPDITAVSAGLKELRRGLEQAAAAKGSLEAREKAVAACIRGVEGIGREREELARQYALAARLYRLLNGENALRTNIHQFVLGLMLDDILSCANLRLNILSRGQYALVRSEEPQRGNGTKGLDLSVNDAWRGGVRSVSTLSGGEMFLASLSLAFGLSDVVQSYAGGIRLDSIFIDEGFGSLDSETLDTAMRALEQLQSSGSGRLIGIISHVGELRERIPARVEVRRLADGSSSVLVRAAGA